jgi:hypothetical protein
MQEVVMSHWFSPAIGLQVGHSGATLRFRSDGLAELTEERARRARRVKDLMADMAMLVVLESSICFCELLASCWIFD